MVNTTHGHHIAGTALLPHEGSRARCGGTALCRVCRAEAAEYIEAEIDAGIRCADCGATCPVGTDRAVWQRRHAEDCG